MNLSEKHNNIEHLLLYIPSNRGYIIDGKKYYGKNNICNNGIDVRLLDDKCYIHHWAKNSYIEEKLSIDDTELLVFTKNMIKNMINNIASSKDMRPCPAEVSNHGLCQERFNPEHRKSYYHFAKYKNNELLLHLNDGSPICKYNIDGNWYCWEQNNPRHCSLFYHY
jgi:hypothetical protein